MPFTVSRLISDETLSRIIQIESAGKPKAKAPTSSATGLGQFITATWLTTIKKYRPDLIKGKSKAAILAMRTDPSISIEMLARLTEESAIAMGSGYTDGDLYLAHFAGVATAKKLLRAPQDAPASKYFTKQAIAANRSILEGKTAGQVRTWASSKMAKARFKDYVSMYYRGNQPEPVLPPPVEEPEVVHPEEPEIELPDIPDVSPPPPPSAPEPKPPVKSKTLWDAVIQKISGFVAMIGALSGQQWLVIICVAIIIGLAAHIFYERYMKDDIKKKRK